MTFIGIDPGKSGAICLLLSDYVEPCSLYTRFYAFDEGVYVDVLASLPRHDSLCILEKVHAMPKQGVSSMFSFGQNFGFIQGVLLTLKIPFQLVEPRTWTRSFGCGNDKSEHIRTAKRLFPTVNLKRTERCTKESDGFADALLLAEYGRRISGTQYPIDRVSIGPSNV